MHPVVSPGPLAGRCGVRALETSSRLWLVEPGTLLLGTKELKEQSYAIYGKNLVAFTPRVRHVHRVGGLRARRSRP
jgi:hypothetical protein